MWCRVVGVGARSRKRAGLGYRLVRKHARTKILGLLISMFPGLGYMRMCPTVSVVYVYKIFWLSLGGYGKYIQLLYCTSWTNCVHCPLSLLPNYIHKN